MAYDSTIPLPQGATKVSESAMDRPEGVINTPVGASLITAIEQLQLLGSDSIRRNNNVLISDAEVYWDGSNLNFNALQQGSNITYRMLQVEAPASAYVDLIMVGSLQSTATSTMSMNTLTAIASVNQLAVGGYVFSPHLSSGTFITQITSTTPGAWAVVLNQNALSNNLLGDLFTFAQPVSFPLSGTVNGTDNTMVGIPTTVGLFPGMPVFGTGIPLGTAIATIVSPTQITLSNVTTSPFTGTFTGYQIVPQTAAFGAVPLNDGDLAYLELDRNAILATTAATAQFIVENGINGSSTNTGHRLVKINLTPTQAMPNLQLPAAGSGPGVTNTFCLPLAARRNATNSEGTFQPLFWVPHGIRWDSGTLGFVGQLQQNSGATFTAGMMIDYAGAGAAPSGFLIADSSDVSRTTFATLFNAVTIQITGDVSNGSYNINNVSSIANLQQGYPISGLGIQAGTTIASFSSGPNQIVMSLPAVGGTTGEAIVVAPYGVGDGMTTFNLPDTRGMVGVGSGIPSGSPAVTTRLLGQTFGEETHLLTAGESGLPPHNHDVNDPGHFHQINTSTTIANVSTGRVTGSGNEINFGLAVDTLSHTTGITVAFAGPSSASSAHNNMQPSFVANKLIKY